MPNKGIELLTKYPKKKLLASLTTLKKGKQLVINGWLQGDYEHHDPDSGEMLVCAAGGLKRADGPGETVGFCALAFAMDEKRALRNYKKELDIRDDILDIDGDVVEDAITIYNDRKSRRKVDVINKFNYAIKLVGLAIRSKKK